MSNIVLFIVALGWNS